MSKQISVQAKRTQTLTKTVDISGQHCRTMRARPCPPLLHLVVCSLSWARCSSEHVSWCAPLVVNVQDSEHHQKKTSTTALNCLMCFAALACFLSRVAKNVAICVLGRVSHSARHPTTESGSARVVSTAPERGRSRRGLRSRTSW